MRPKYADNRRRVTITCQNCGSPFQARKDHAADGRAKYCSRQCLYASHSTRRLPIGDRFWAKVDKSSKCWLWTGGTTRGYGTFFVGIHERAVPAHRVSWQLANGPIPDGLWVLHECDTPLCVRPDHLFLGTQTDNMQDAAAKGRVRNQSTKLTAEDVRTIRSRYATGGVFQHELAAEFGVGQTQISRIIRLKRWSPRN